MSVAVIGPSMGGMQTCNGASAIPLHGRAGGDRAAVEDPGWSVAVMEASRKAIMTTGLEGRQLRRPPEKGIRLWRDIVNLLAARTPDMYAAQFKNASTCCPGWSSRRPPR